MKFALADEIRHSTIGYFNWLKVINDFKQVLIVKFVQDQG